MLMAEFDVIVIGAGPAGVNAAFCAASAGLEVALFDENPDESPAALGRSVGENTVTRFFAHAVWSVTGEYRIDAVGPDGPVQCTARALIVASGATVRIVPFEGWTLPGVIDMATAAKRLASQGSLPGRSTLVVGLGPWLAAVAAKTIEAGGKVAAIVDGAGAAESVRARPAKDGRADLRGQRLNWWRTIRRAGTRRYGRWTIVRAEPAGEGLRATLARCDAGGRAIDAPRTTVLADCIVVGHGFIPATEITALLRARHAYSRAAGGWVAVTDDDGRTSRALLYCAGDAAGIAGADAAASHGTLAGLACALDLGVSDSVTLKRRIAAARREFEQTAGLRRAMANLMALRSAQVDGIPAEIIVCRCEEVRRADIDAACDAGANDMNQLKAWTRCGMGPCQGRLCGDVAGELLMQRMGASRERVGRFTARTPLRPVPLDALTGDFEYEDIAIPNAAPL
jgi:NADPH-dependent 2,4-dienoyl-CoA reductase/sulfur reductase-like enzyme